MAASSVSPDGKANFTRLYRLIVDEGTKALRTALDEIQPSDKLAEELNHVKPKLENELRNRKKILNDDQWELLYPVPGDPSYSNFDITLLFILIRNGIGNLRSLTRPPKGWNKLPEEGDKSKEANFVRIKFYRNQMSHNASTDIETSTFESLCAQIAKAITALGADKREIYRLKTESLDPSLIQKMESWKKKQEEEQEQLQAYFEHLEDEISKETIDRKEDVKEVRNRIDDLEKDVQFMNNRLDTQGKHDLNCEIPDRLSNFKGRSEETKKIADLLRNDAATGAILITGGPGHGKTAVAVEVAHDLEKDMVVKFCNLRGFANSFTDLLRQISFVCTREVGKQIEDDPKTAKYILLNWCKDLDIGKNLVLCLDNAEDALEGELKEEFIKLLSEMRTHSNRQINFLITSRTEVASTTLFSVKPVLIGPLCRDDSVEVIKQSFVESQVKMKAGKKGLSDVDASRLTQVAELCNYVPLALCISGALLYNYSIDELIAKLKENPSKTLKDHKSGQNIEKAIAASFNVLDEKLKHSLVALAVFIGPFGKEAARVLLGKHGDDCEEILILLEAKSLIERAPLGRYVMHSLAQSYVRNTGNHDHHLLYQESEQKYFDYFMSVLEQYSKKYWSKDNCKKSIELFSSDRLHLEHAIMMFSEKSENSQTVSNVLKDVEDISCYLQMCIPPNLYELFLESALRLAEHSSDGVLQVLVLCQLGHELRKKGGKKVNTRTYQDCMEQANLIWKKSSKQFASRQTKKADLHFLNSYIRFLKTKELDTEDCAQQLKRAFSDYCINEFDGAHLSKFQTLQEEAFSLKGKKQFKKAHKLFVQTQKNKEKYLGIHVLTAYSLKDLADLQLQQNHKKEALKYYTKTLEMFKNLGMLGAKESILPLKNVACCLLHLENWEEAKLKLKMAQDIAEKNLKGDHKWKVWLKSVEVELCSERERKLSIAEEADAMARRLQLTKEEWTFQLKRQVYAVLGKRM